MATSSTFVIVTRRRWINGSSQAIERSMRERIWIERLEARVLMAGQFDLSFGTGGITQGDLVQDNDFHINRVMPQQDGTLLVGVTSGAQDEWIARLDANGTFDRSIGAGGLVQIAKDDRGMPEVPWRFVGEFEMDPDGRFLIAAGNTYNDFPGTATVELSRVNADGTLDTSFGSNGVTEVSIPPHRMCSAEARGTIIDSLGRITVGIATNDYSIAHHNYFYLVRFLADGSVDQSFGANGVLEVAPPVDAGIAGDLCQDRYGHLILSGYTMDQNGQRRAAMARFDSSGQLDQTFGNRGWVLEAFDSTDALFAKPQFDSQGRAIVTMYRALPGESIYGHHVSELIRLNYAGAIDTNFHPPQVIGYQDEGIGQAVGYFPTPIFVQPDDKLIATYTSEDVGGTRHNWMIRLNADGSADSTFGEKAIARAWLTDTGYGTALAITGNRLLIASALYEAVPRDGYSEYFGAWQIAAMDAGEVVSLPLVPISEIEKADLPTAPTGDGDARDEVLHAPDDQSPSEPVEPVLFMPAAREPFFGHALARSTSLVRAIVESKHDDDLLAPSNDDLLR